MHDKKARWNQLLVEEVFPEVYVELIKYAIEQGIVAAEVYTLWPQVNDLKGAWKRGMHQTIAKLKEHPILHTDVGNGSWKTPAEEEVYINDITPNNQLIQRVLLHQMYPVVQLPSHVLEALVWGKVYVHKVTPSVVREAIRSDKLQWLTRAEKMQLLDYILSDGQYSDLEGVHLLPLQNGDFVPFSRNGEAVYVPSFKVPGCLFPNMDSGLTSKDCPTALTSSQTAISNYQLTKLTEAIVPSLLKDCLPHEWVNGNANVTWTPGSRHQPPKDWLEKLWIWLKRVTISLHSFLSLPMVQVSTSANRVELARLQVNRLIFQRETNWNTYNVLPDSVCQFLGSIGAVIIRHDLPTFIMQHSEIKSFIMPGNGEGVMHILEALWNQANVPDKVQLSTASLRHDLGVLLSSVHLPAQWKKLLVDISIFKSSDGNFVSARQCPEGLPHGFHGVPLKKPRQCFMILDGSSKLAISLGVQEVSLKDFLVQYVFLDVGNHLYDPMECEQVMTWVLEKPHLDDFIKEVKFLPTSTGNFSTARELFDPTAKLKSLFKDQPVFPTGSYASYRMLLHLKRIGLRDESHISPDEILGIANAVSKTQDGNRGLSLLKYICQYHGLCIRSSVYSTHNPLRAALLDIAWLPCESARPRSYPKSLPWFGRSCSLYCPKELMHIEMANLLGSVAPIVRAEVCSELSKFLGWTSNGNSETILDLVVDHMRNVIRSSHQGVQAESVLEIVHAIYQYLGKISQDLVLPHFSADGIMAQEAWVWHGRGFTSPNKIAFSSVIPVENLAPYLHVVPHELDQYKSMLGKLGVRQSFTIHDYIIVFETLKKSCGSNPLDEQQLAIVQDTIKAILTFGDVQQPVQSQIYVPDSNSMLRIIEDLTYSDQLQDYPSGYVYTHHSITAKQAKQLGIKTHRDIQLDQCSTDSGFEGQFGQTEKLTTRLRGILREYSHKPDVLKELLQNADDAGATEVHIVYDPRRHTGKHISGPEWEPLHSAPAICIYNDKPFTDADIEGIQNVGVGGKITDTTTTGRFGIGFNAVYHLTDCPTFLTQNKTKLCIFDPHVKYVPRATQARPGKIYYKERNLGFLTVMSDMIEGYLQEFDQFDLEEGTMFRFPLRGPGIISEISDECYDDHDVYNLLSEFETVSREAVLFLKNIQKISISEIDQDTGNLKSRYQVTADISEEGKKQREDLAHHLRSNKDVDIGDIPQIIRGYALEIKDSKGNEGYWFVSQAIGLDPALQNDDINKMSVYFKAKSHLPVGGVAAPLDGDFKYGKAFCLLPLQIDTKLPVHVNGTFVLDQSRRNLKTGDNKDLIHPWNRLLAESVIGPAYASLIKEAGRILYRSSLPTYKDGQWSCWQYDKLFPTNLDSLQGVWKLTGMATLRYISNTNMAVLPVVKGGSAQQVVKEGSTQQHKSITWCTTKSGYFDNLSTLDTSEGHTTDSDRPVPVRATQKEKTSSIVRKFLQRTGFLLISGSTAICIAFQKVGVETEFISPKTCLKHLQKLKCIAHSLPCHISETTFQTPAILKTVLDYCSGGIQAVSDLQGLPFQLDGSNVLDTFSGRDPKYITYYYDLLPRLTHLFIHSDIIGTLYRYKYLPKVYYMSTQLLKNFTIHELAKHIDTELPPEWKGSTRHMKVSDNLPRPYWLKRLWSFICQHCNGKHIDDIEALADWPIIPTASGNLVSIKMAKTVLYLDTYTDTPDRHTESRVLKKLGCPVVDVDKMTYLSKSIDLAKILTKHLSTPSNCHDVLRVIHNMSDGGNATLTGQLTPSECDILLRYFQPSCGVLSAKEILQIKQLPLFPLATSQNRVSIHDSSQCYTYKGSLPNLDYNLLMQVGRFVFICYSVSLGHLYEQLGINQIAMVDICCILLQELHLFPRQNQLANIISFRDTILSKMDANDKVKLYDILQRIKFIPGDDGCLHEAAYHYDVSNPVFSAMIDHSRHLPNTFRGDEWRELLINSGLQHLVTGEQFIKFAKEIEQASGSVRNEEQYIQLKRKSMILSDELRSNSKLYECETMNKIAPIRFIAPVEISPAKQDVCPQFSSTPGSGVQKSFICFLGAVPQAHEDLTWTVNELIPSRAVPQREHLKYRNKRTTIPIHQYLGIQSTPVLGNVMQHIKNVCNRMAVDNSHYKEDRLNKDTRRTLIEVVTKMMDYLNDNMRNNEGVIKKGLQDTPMCLVDEGVILTRANQLVFDMPKYMEDQLRPYLYKAPRNLANYDKVLHLLGAQDETSFDQLAMVLKEISGVCKNSKMNVNDKNKAHAATRHLFQLLQSTEGKCPITVHQLYLPTTMDKLRLSTNLYYTDLGEIESIQLPSSDNIEFVIPLKQVLSYVEVYGSHITRNETGLMGLLPDKDPCNLRPQKLDTTERVLETNIACDDGMGHQCALVKEMRLLYNSEDLQEILPRLFHHQMKQIPDTQQETNIVQLRDFNNFRCVKELKTGYYDSAGKLCGERKGLRQAFLVQLNDHGDTFELHLNHTYDDDNSVLFLPLAESINHICALDLDTLRIGYLREVLACKSKEAKNNFLESHGIPKYEDLIGELGPLIERPGDIVPRDLWCLLDDDMSNKFHSGDMAVYNDPVEDGSGDAVDKRFYVYANIIERLPMEYASEDEEDESLLRKYRIDIGGKKPIVVSVVKLFMFRRFTDICEESDPQDTAVELYMGQSEETSNEHLRLPGESEETSNEHLRLPCDLEDAKRKIRKDVSEAMKLPENERKECIRRLYRMWHPDKNPQQVALATEAFKFLKQEIERPGNVSSTSSNGPFTHRHSGYHNNFSDWDSNIRRDRAEHQEYQEFRQRHFHSTGSSFFREQRYRNQSSRNHFHGTGSTFSPHSFTNERPDPRKARLWYRQAEEDLKAANEYNTVETSLAWPAFMIQQAAEKALKAALFQLKGSKNLSHDLDHLVDLVCQHRQAHSHKEMLLYFVRHLVLLDCHATRPRYPEDGSNLTTGETFKSFKKMEALHA